MKISFVIPAYNEEKYISNCLMSIFNEILFPPRFEYEVIVVNNASNDKTGYIAKTLYPSVKIIDESRKGITYARQAGFLAATGDLIANVDADSRLPKGWVDYALSEFKKNPDLVTLSGPVVYYDLNSYQRKTVNFFYGIAFLIYFINNFILRVGSMVQGGNFIVRRSALEEIGGFDTNISFYGEDTDIARRMSKIGKVKFTNKLKMLSSARRLKGEGMLTIAYRYTLNYFWTTFFKHPFTKDYIDIRK